ncbi:MAG: FkbM family methyltransferase [Promethearchaeota archaeon]
MILELLIWIIEKIHISISRTYSYLFNRLNKKLFVKFKFIEIFQINSIKVLNRLSKKKGNLLPTKMHDNALVTRDKLIFKAVKDIVDYSIINNINIEEYSQNFDHISKDTIKHFIRGAYYIYTNSVIRRSYLFNREELQKRSEISKYVNDIKKRIKLPINYYIPSVFYYHCGLKFLPKILLKDLIETDIIDGGAFVGDSAIIFERYYQPNKIYAFEPESRNYDLMLQTMEMNNLKKNIPIKKGLNDKEINLKFKSIGALSYISKKGKNIIETTTIDDFVFKNSLNIGLIKMDIEGYELNALIGAKETIKKFKPLLLIAIYHNGKQFFETIKLIKKIYPNYTFIIRKLTPFSFLDEIFLIAWIQE